MTGISVPVHPYLTAFVLGGAPRPTACGLRQPNNRSPARGTATGVQTAAPRDGAALGAAGVLGAISSRSTELEGDLGQATYGHSASSRAQRDAAGDSSAAAIMTYERCPGTAVNAAETRSALTDRWKSRLEMHLMGEAVLPQAGLSQLRAAPTATSGTWRVEKRRLLKPESSPCPGTKLHIFLRLTTGSFAKHFHH
ncbi:hypothetical protein Anapl_14460 [Anas platyrhynchos]|uniref:Uncharacterized protein n=1 Tax=Anas platyrhynchos TaxID=8839 RepID=R0M427_ANAPL|nr:hypothetical protein Anapl_14460 [Anas platyrhynchos]